METQKPLLKDEDSEEVDVDMYRSMNCSLMYLTSSRPDIMFAVCAFARYQVNSKVSHLQAVKRIFRFAYKAFDIDNERELCKNKQSDLVRKRIERVGENKTKRELCKNRQSDLVRKRNERSGKNYYWEVQLQALVDGKKVIITESTVRRDLQLEDAEGVDCLPNAAIFEQLTLMGVGKGFSGRETPSFPTMMVQDQKEIGEGLANPTDPHHTPTIIQPSTSQPQRNKNLGKAKRKDTELPQTSDPTTNIADEAVNKEMDDSLEKAATTASRCQETMGITLLRPGDSRSILGSGAKN
nr:putative ribonuclease H-like domain-containing protein [Tanacetum cinerariifolium]